MDIRRIGNIVFIPGAGGARYPRCNSLFIDDEVRAVIDPGSYEACLRDLAAGSEARVGIRRQRGAAHTGSVTVDPVPQHQEIILRLRPIELDTIRRYAGGLYTRGNGRRVLVTGGSATGK